MLVPRLNPGLTQALRGGLELFQLPAEAMREAALLPTQAEAQFLSSRPLGKFTVETDTLLKVLLRPGVAAGRAGSEDYSGAASQAHCPLKRE